MFELCLFDLDDTLVLTSDLDQLRRSALRNSDPDYVRNLQRALRSRNRYVYSLALLNEIKRQHPRMRLGVFTRSPRLYAHTVLTTCYPGFEWDALVAYEDVQNTKPYGDGVHFAMNAVGVRDLERVVLVGDNNADVRSAYHAGCVVALDKTTWPQQRVPEHWYALEKLPDALLSQADEVLEFLAAPDTFLPELERLLATDARPARPLRFDKINHFIPHELGAERPYPIWVAGRSFAGYDSLRLRRGWHVLTQSIEDNKNSREFPAEWVQAVRAFIDVHMAPIVGTVDVCVSVVPHRPERTPRLERFLEQLQASLMRYPLSDVRAEICPDLFAYQSAVVSQHLAHLRRVPRFLNVRDNLYVNNRQPIARGKLFLIIDDVVTTGASLIYATKYLRDAGAEQVFCLGLAKNISDVIE